MILSLLFITIHILSITLSISKYLSKSGVLIQSGSGILIESNTNLCNSDYKTIYTIDSFESYICHVNRKDVNNIHYNSNRNKLIDILSTINDQVTIWLNKYMNEHSDVIQIMNDLDDLCLHQVKNHIIIIDNVRKDGISSQVFEIMNKIMNINSKYVFSLEGDFLVATIINKEKPLLQQLYGFNVYSQGGEDGIIEKIFSIIGTNNKVAVEFGAWDGWHLSNTANLWSNKELGWKGILIEANEDRYNVLKESTSEYNCHTICSIVGINDNSLENILERNNEVYDDIDLLSIDIDSDDYYIFESLTGLRCRIVIVEYNPTIPAVLDIYQELGSNVGSSVKALCRIGTQKNMTLVAITATNLIFVSNTYMHLLEEFGVATDDFGIERMKYDNQLQYLITSYTGDYAIVASKTFTDPYGTKDSTVTNLHNGENAIITTDLGKRIVEFIINTDIVANQVYTTLVKGIVHDHTVQYTVEKDLKAGTKIQMKI